MKQTKQEHPFKRKREHYLKYASEYRKFLSQYDPIFKKFAASDYRFQQLELIQSSFVKAFELQQKNGKPVENPPPPTLQFQFGNMPLGLGRRAVDGEVASELGATLIYSFGPTGATAVMLYPADGNLGSAIESSILLRIGYFDKDKLLSMLPDDLKRWVNYAHVSALDGDPTLRERISIRWLRLRQILYIDNKPQSAILSEKFKKLGVAAATGSLSGIMKIAGGAAVGFVLGYLAK